MKLPLELLGASSAVEGLRALVEQAVSGDDHVLVTVEPGLSAERVAREIHDGRTRSAAPFVTCDCAAAMAVRVEHDVLGISDGASDGQPDRIAETSAMARAVCGTLFLSHVEELSFSAQARLARFLRDGQVLVGANPTGTRLNVRVVACSERDLEAEVSDGRFQRDLYQRFTLRLEVPALRRRPEDIPLLVNRLAENGHDSAPVAFSDEAMTLLSALPWRGNLHELAEVVGRLVRDCRDQTVSLQDVLAQVQLERAPASFRFVGSLQAARRSFEHDFIAAMLHRHGWRMGDTAKALGMQRPNLYRKVRQLGIARIRTRS